MVGADSSNESPETMASNSASIRSRTSRLTAPDRTSLMNDKLVITFGSDFNFATAGGNQTATGAQSFLFLPDVNVEYKITPDGKFRTSFFYRSNFDALSTSGKRDRTGGNISFRTEFDRFFEKKKKLSVENQ